MLHHLPSRRETFSLDLAYIQLQNLGLPLWQMVLVGRPAPEEVSSFLQSNISSANLPPAPLLGHVSTSPRNNFLVSENPSQCIIISSS